MATNSVNAEVCGICFRGFGDPRLLPCLHSFCRNCIHELTLNSGDQLTCPHCRAPFGLPANGAAGLPKDVTRGDGHAFACDKCGDVCGKEGPIGWCKTCERTFCDTHGMEHLKVHGAVLFAISAEKLPSGPSKSSHCTDHGKPLSVYCETCGVAVCASCSQGQHGGHETIAIGEKLASDQEVVSANVEDLGRREDLLQLCIQAVPDVRKRLSDDAKNVRHEIRAAGELVKGTVNACVEQLLEEVTDWKTTHKKVVELQEEALKEQLKDVRSVLQFSERLGSLCQGEQTEKLRLLQQFNARCSSVLEQSTAEDLSLAQYTPVSFDQSDNMLLAATIHQCIGRVLPGRASAEHSCVAPEDTQKVCRGERVTFTVEVKNAAGLSLGRGGDKVEASWQETPTIAPTVDITDHSDGVYALSFLPQEDGLYSLTISVNGHTVPSAAKCVCETIVYRFDSKERHEDISLSDDRRLATMCSSSGHCSLLGERAMCRGRHKWTVQLGENYYLYNIGIAAKPLSAKKMKDHENSSDVYCWQTDGFKWRATDGSFGKLRSWEGKDKVELVLDLSKHVLTAMNLRSGESDSFHDVPIRDYYAYFSMCRLSNSITFVDES